MLFLALWMGTRKDVAPVVASSLLVIMGKASVRPKPTHCGGKRELQNDVAGTLIIPCLKSTLALYLLKE